MASAKDIIVKPIKSSIANEFVKKHHYSGRVVPNSQLHFGCFLNGVLGGVMSFGASMDKNKTCALVKNTPFNDFLELNRMAFSDLLPRNSESRCISIAIRLIKKYYPNMKWIISFADGCQCGDGTIYRASGFKLTSIKKNTQIMEFPDGTRIARKSLDHSNHIGKNGRYGSAIAKEMGAKYIGGYQLRYIYFIDKSKEKDLTVPVLPFSMIDEMNARMYKGVSYKRNASLVQEQNSNFPVENGGATPTDSLHNIGKIMTKSKGGYKVRDDGKLDTGRPTKLTPETIDKLRTAFLMGCSDIEACLYADISKTALYNYQQKNPDFVDQKEQWKEQLTLKARTVVANALNNKDENTAKWYLERKAKNEFSTKVENETTINGIETALVVWK